MIKPNQNYITTDGRHVTVVKKERKFFQVTDGKRYWLVSEEGFALNKKDCLMVSEPRYVVMTIRLNNGLSYKCQVAMDIPGNIDTRYRQNYKKLADLVLEQYNNPAWIIRAVQTNSVISAASLGDNVKINNVIVWGVSA